MKFTSIEVSSEHIRHVNGYLYEYALPLSTSYGDDNVSPKSSAWRLCEDGKVLPFPHSVHGNIENIGSGRYSHWSATLFFSSSDGSDPRENGRKYILKPTFSIILSMPAIRQSILFLRYSVSALGLLILRCLTWLLFLPELVALFNTRSHTSDFPTFYHDTFNLGEGTLSRFLTYYIRRYMDRDFYQSHPIIRPSIEVAVGDGTASLTFFDHVFDVGTEYYLRDTESRMEKLPHKRLEYMDIKKPDTERLGTFETLVMVHSIDDFDSPETGLVFDMFQSMTRSGGCVYMSGFTDIYPSYWLFFRLKKIHQNEIKFYDVRGLHEENMMNRQRVSDLADTRGLKMVDYRECGASLRFKIITILEEMLSVSANFAGVRSYLWRYSSFRRIHISVNLFLVRAILHADTKARDQGNRGLDFSCKLIRVSPD